ncbi:MAG: U32 family peptidase [Endomicrobiia bacterium]
MEIKEDFIVLLYNINMKNYFNITSGFNNIESISKIKQAGATELYTGFFDQNINKKWPISFNILNRRGEDANFNNWDEFCIAICEAKKFNLPVYVTFNGLYTEKQHRIILDTIDKVSELDGVKGIIVNDMALLLLLQERAYNKEIVVSTGGTTFNTQTVQFYKSLGAKRIILDRQLPIKDIVNIINTDKTLHYEIFGFGGSCFFIDGFCSFFHCSENLDYTKKIVHTYNVNQFNTGCHLIESNIKKYQKEYNSIYKNYNVVGENFLDNMRHSCNLCNLYDLREFKNISLKIVNRKNSTVSFVEVVKLAIDKLKVVKTKSEYIKYCKKILEEEKIFKCKETQCYYK